MTTQDDLKKRLDELGERIEAMREEIEMRELGSEAKCYKEIKEHYEFVEKEIESDVHDFETKYGHVNTLEKMLIRFMDSIED